MTALDYLASVKARSTAATPGPWTFDDAGDWPSNEIKAGDKTVLDGAGCGCCGSGLYADNDADPKFAAAARTDVDRLVAMVEAAREFIEQSRCDRVTIYFPDSTYSEHNAECARCKALAELDRIAAGEVGE